MMRAAKLKRRAEDYPGAAHRWSYFSANPREAN